MNLKLLAEALQRREDYWRQAGQDDNLGNAVMTALAEVRSAVLEAEQLEDTPPTPTEIVNPPRDLHLPKEDSS
jgi:hypothetical protein